MSTTTATLGLTLPTETEAYDINIVNTNNTAIDNAIGVLVSELSGSGGIGGKVDAIQTDVTETKATVNTIQTTTETIQTQAEQNGTDIATVKTVADSISTKLVAISETMSKMKSFALAKKATIGSSAWQTAVNITGSGTITKALSLADAAYQMRITVDDEVVFYCNGLKGKWAGVLEDVILNGNAVYTPVMEYSGTIGLSPMNSSDSVWQIGCPGSDVISAAVCFVTGGLKFYRNFKLEFMSFVTGAVTVTGIISQEATTTTV